MKSIKNIKSSNNNSKEIIILILFVLAVLLGEFLMQLNTSYGFLFYAILILASLIALSKVDEYNTLGKIALFILIIPMIRVSEVFLTLGFFWRNLIFYSFFLFLVLFYVKKFNININYKIKLNKSWLILIALALGTLFGFIGNYLFQFAKTPMLLPVLVIAAFSEEILFRRMIQEEIKSNYNKYIAIIIPSIIYGIFSSSYGLYVALFYFVLNIINGFVYNYTENITLCIIINLVANAVLFAL